MAHYSIIKTTWSTSSLVFYHRSKWINLLLLYKNVMTRKISSSKSQNKSLNNLTGKKEQQSLGKSKTMQSLSQNTKALTTSTKQKKKKLNNTLIISNSCKLDLFPYLNSFPIFLHDLTDNKRCWFTCIDHAQKYIDRYKPNYKCYQYTCKWNYH